MSSHEAVGNFGGSRHEDDDRLSAAGLDAGLIFGTDDGNRLDRDGKFLIFNGSPRIGQPFSHDVYAQPPEPISVTDVTDVIDVAAINEWQ
ncbi:hypothetical protein C0Q70_09870 [Pomacea canaliculata]|uniref:Uncharacterized protein n=1 Tax=Pomacea canaliculata TaxID=400727 RepID=A0A2T7PB10_POMCA|nr:hypothetical protein C0Q70_09870 [Pomacea canaliculata]